MTSEHDSQSTSDNSLLRFDKIRRDAIVTGVAAGILCWIVAFFGYALLKSIRHNDVMLHAATLFLQSLYVGAPILGYVAYDKVAKREGILLWMRRFRAGYGDKIRFHTVLGRACSAILFPITIQDSSFRTSFFSGLLRISALLPFWMFLWLVGFIYLSAVVPVSGSILILFALWTALCVCGTWLLLKRTGFVTLRGKEARSKARARFHSLKSNARGLGIGVEILKCDDDIWKEIVLDGLSQAELAIIDISDQTEHILWELSQALTSLGRNRTIVVCEDDPDTMEIAMSKTQKFLEKEGYHLESDWLKRSVVPYPNAQAAIGPKRNKQYETLIRRLRQEIAIRIPT